MPSLRPVNAWTEERIRAQASWDAFRDGRKLAADGLVAGLKAKPGLVTATVGAGRRPHRVVVRMGGALEAQCDCPVNRSTGALCAHAVAALLAALAADAAPVQTPVSAKVGRAPLPPCKPMTLRLPPDFTRSLARGRLTLELEFTGTPDPADECLWAWLGGLTDLHAPPSRLALGPEALSGFIDAASGHPRVFDASGQKIEVGVMPPLPVRSSRFADDTLEIGLDDSGAQTIAAIDRLAWATPRAFGFAPWSPEDPSQLEDWRMAIDSRQARIPRERLADVLQAWLDLTASPRSGWLGELQFETIHSKICLEIDGSLQALDLEVRGGELGRMEVDTARCRVRAIVTAGERDLSSTLTAAGLENRGSGRWALRGRDRILAFLADDLPELEERFEIRRGDRFKQVTQSLHFVRPVVSSPSGGSLALELSFQTGGGVQVPRAKVMDWVRSGRASVAVKSGAELVLSRRIRDEFEALAADLGIPRPEGRIHLDRARAEVLGGWAGTGGRTWESPIETVAPPEGIRLRPYQVAGLNWLCNRLIHLGGALLADEMGLGKTLQTILALRSLQSQGRCGRVLVLVPGSLLANWEIECGRFAPDARVLRFHGDSRDALRGREADLVITSYGTFQRDLAFHLAAGYGAVVLDEASMIRNPDSAISRDVAKLQVPFRIALTGTPMENRLTDLWSIFRFVCPGYLGSKEDFRERYEGGGMAAARRLRARLSPFVLRRVKSEVARDLPDKIESDVVLELDPAARRLYQEVAAAGLIAAGSVKSAGASRMHLLTTLLRLRQTCLDTSLLPGHGESSSAKREWLKQMLETKISNDSNQGSIRSPKCLVFSQFTGILRLLNDQYSGTEWKVFQLDGSTRNRGSLVAEFQAHEGPALFLISLKAGGYGLNLTAADTVVHMDPWWNPAAEAQATDRAHRMGQTVPVTIYRLIIRDSVEERVRRMQAGKRSLMAGLDGADPEGNWSDEDLSALIR